MGRHLEHRGLELCETGEQERSVAARPGRALGDQGLYFPPAATFASITT